MRYIFVVAFIITICSCNRHAGPKSYLDEHGIKGKVKQITEYTYTDERSFKANQPLQKDILNFNAEGNLLDETSIVGGVEGVKNILKYDKQKIVSTAYMNNTVMGYLTATLDKSGRRVQEEFYPAQTSPAGGEIAHSWTAIKYNGDGNVAEEDNYDGGKTMGSKKTYVYNNKEQKIEQRLTSYGAEGTKIEKTVYAYDDAGNEVKQSQYDTSGKLIFEQLSTYSNIDQNGNWLLSNSNATDYTIEDLAQRNSKTFTRREIKYFE